MVHQAPRPVVYSAPISSYGGGAGGSYGHGGFSGHGGAMGYGSSHGIIYFLMSILRKKR